MGRREGESVEMGATRPSPEFTEVLGEKSDRGVGAQPRAHPGPGRKKIQRQELRGATGCHSSFQPPDSGVKRLRVCLLCPRTFLSEVQAYNMTEPSTQCRNLQANTGEHKAASSHCPQ